MKIELTNSEASFISYLVCQKIIEFDNFLSESIMGDSVDDNIRLHVCLMANILQKIDEGRKSEYENESD